MKLAQLQQWMQAALLAQGEKPDSTQIGLHICASAQLSANDHLAIYQRGYFARLLQCMQGQFKALCYALGRPLFDDFARQYLRERPSTSATLAILGQDFPSWLQANRPDTEQHEDWIDFMVDLAHFEWMLYSLFDAQGDEASGYANADEANHDGLRPQRALRLGQYRYPVNIYYRQVAQEEPATLPAAQAVHLALVRSHYRIGIYRLLPAQYHFLHTLILQGEGSTIANALHHTAQAFSKDLASVQAAWQNWQVAWLAAGFFRKP